MTHHVNPERTRARAAGDRLPQLYLVILLVSCVVAALVSCGGGSTGGPGSPQAGSTGNPSPSGGSGGNAPPLGTGGGTGGGVSAGGSGTVNQGGTTSASGGSSASAGGTSAAAGTGATGGTPITVVPEANRVRTVIPFDTGWLFNKGDATGADQTTFADTAWRALSVPHDWSIEGPFDQNATTTGRGGYLPAGIGWYRKHFTLPQTLSGSRVFIEFDGVMANSDVYINGVHLGTRPYGYVGFRYDMTSNVKFGTTDNVISVKCDNSTQPASRYYTGAGIYRHVRVLATDPVHVDQWATYVSTPTPSATTATVHVTTVIVNDGTAAQSVSVQGVVTDPTGTALAPVAAAAQSVAPGKTGATFTFDVPVSNPKLWDTTTPNMYSLSTQVVVGGKTVDDDVTPFGIRSIVFDGTTGMSLNGKSLKFKGVALHEEVSGLGSAVPARGWQRRLAELKALGVNAIRTAHNPFPPEVFDLADRMGLLVLDEFFDAWVAHKYTDVGDYGAFFSKTPPAITGSPTVPATISGGAPTWWQTDITDIVMHDRNHPSVALYSTGNEIRDSLATRTPILTKMVALCHLLDPARSVTQALFDASSNGDTAGATRTTLDVWGNNYSVSDCTTAIAASPKRAGVLTEMGHETTTWTTVMNTPALTGEFIWTGADYLGEAPNGWPTVGSALGLIDRVGTITADGYTYQKLWGGISGSAPASGSAATKVALTADHTTLLTDLNDVTYVKAAISDDSGKVVTSSAAAVTFAITGPGTIIAVDSGSQTQESFRGKSRNAFKGICYAIVQATGPGAITVTASASGLTGGTATIQGAAGAYTPCSGTCD